MKIVADSAIPYLKGVLEPYADITYLPGKDIDRESIRNANAVVVRTRTQCDAALLAGSDVEIIASATIGLDHIDLDYCAKAGVKVISAPGCNARGVLQWVAAVLALDSDARGYHPRGKSLGVVGVGNVGTLVAEYATLWGFNTILCDPPRMRGEGGFFVDLGEIADSCDIITFHTPLSRTGPDATFHMADENFFKKVKSDTLIINSSRGEVIDTEALLDAIKTKNCLCAIDTWESEPQPDKLLLDAALVATPHIAGYTIQGKANATSMVVRALATYFGWALTGWYPKGIAGSYPKSIGWAEMKSTIKDFCNLDTETNLLKNYPEKFEKLRTDYIYRTEYF